MNPSQVLARRVSNRKDAGTLNVTSPPQEGLVIFLTDQSSQIEKMRIRKTQAFKDMWPMKCDATRSDGEVLAVNTDGFRCHEGKGVADIVDVTWKENPPAFVC